MYACHSQKKIVIFLNNLSSSLSYVYEISPNAGIPCQLNGFPFRVLKNWAKTKVLLILPCEVPFAITSGAVCTFPCDRINISGGLKC